MEDASFRGLNAMFPDVQKLYCVRHLKQCDDQKLDKLLAKLTCTEAEKPLSINLSSRIFMVSVKVTCRNMDWLNHQKRQKLESLKNKWDSRCPGFFQWFNKKHNKKVCRGGHCFST